MSTSGHGKFQDLSPPVSQRPIDTNRMPQLQSKPICNAPDQFITFSSQGVASEEEFNNKGGRPNLETERSFNKLPEASKEQCAALKTECNLLREENTFLMQALSMSKQDVEFLTSEKEELLKELNIERQKMKDLKEEIHVFSLAFSQREGLLTALYSKSKAMVENLKASQVPIPELCDR